MADNLKINLSLYLLCCLLIFSLLSAAQPMPVPDAAAKVYPFVNMAVNRINSTPAMDSFYRKLQIVKKTGKGTVKIVHIGDSHLQAGYISGVVRKGLQSFFGNAGRGLVFPYQLAGSNAPYDISASSNTQWTYNRVAHPELSGAPGISGFYISSSALAPSISISLKSDPDVDQSFTRMRFFTEANNSWIIHAGTSSTPYVSKREAGEPLPYDELQLDEPATGFSMTALSGSGNIKKFYGVSLENNKAGVLYHTIGVNGARYDSYNNAALFMEQLPALKADLYIISLGTNEAQKTVINGDELMELIKTFVVRLRAASPGAAVLITTPADSFLAGRSLSAPMNSVHSALAFAAASADLPLWDLYFITGSYGSARSWKSMALMSGDNIHYNRAGYELQGTLLLSALANGYNQYSGKEFNPFDLLK